MKEWRRADGGPRREGPPSAPPRGGGGGAPVRDRRRDRGAALLLALALLVLTGLLLNAALVHSGRVDGAQARRQERESALLEARGGVRWAAARLSRGQPVEPARTDAEGVLRVSVEGDRIRAARERAGGVVRRASARWRRGAVPELSEWEED